jgi:hypothetical protein
MWLPIESPSLRCWAYDAEFHVPERLRLDYNGGVDAWLIGGSIRRERLKKQALARKFPDARRHQLPMLFFEASSDPPADAAQ